MLKLFEEINALPGIKGILANIQDVGIVSTGLEDELSPELLAQFKIFLDRQAARSSAYQDQELEIRFNEAVILVHGIDQHTALAVIGEPDLNLGLLNVTLEMLQGELQAAAAQMRQSPLQDGTSKLTTADNSPRLTTEVEEFGLSQALQSKLTAIKQAMIATIGPIAETITRDSVKSWIKAGPATVERFNELIDLLCMEIGDNALESEFRQAVKPIISGEAATAQKKPRTGTGPEKIQVSKQMAEKLTELLRLYSTAMGPVGGVIMKDYLRQWAADGEPSAARIPELISMLAKEIPDPAAREKFLRANKKT